MDAGEDVRYLEEDSFERGVETVSENESERGEGKIVSGVHPYMRIGAHRDGRDLRYGGLERYKN